MKKHILPIGSLVFVIVVIGYLLYQHFEKGVVTGKNILRNEKTSSIIICIILKT